MSVRKVDPKTEPDHRLDYSAHPEAARKLRLTLEAHIQRTLPLPEGAVLREASE